MSKVFAKVINESHKYFGQIGEVVERNFFSGFHLQFQDLHSEDFQEEEINVLTENYETVLKKPIVKKEGEILFSFWHGHDNEEEIVRKPEIAPQIGMQILYNRHWWVVDSIALDFDTGRHTKVHLKRVRKHVEEVSE